MDLHLQFGYGMMGHCCWLVEQWGRGTVILSPRDLEPEQLPRLSSEVTRLAGGSVLLDPQFYLPRSDHERLQRHDYWPRDYETTTFWQAPALHQFVSRLVRLNLSLQTREFIVPGLLTSEVDDIWVSSQRVIIEEVASRDTGLPLLSTIALTADAVRSQDLISSILEASEAWPVSGYYIVLEHPNGDYLVKDPVWVANVLDLTGGLKLRGSKVVLGYCNHQMLVAACTKVDAIASGTWMNVRSFPPDKFRAPYEDEHKQRATWYYCPQALSEYKLLFLDMANRRGLLDLMAPTAEMDGGYASTLFSGVLPSASEFGASAAFRHYLHCLREQALSSVKDSFDETQTHHEEALTRALSLTSSLRSSGVRGDSRDFNEIVDVNFSALADLNSTRGPILRRRWTSL